jgi:hypothetical protein
VEAPLDRDLPCLTCGYNLRGLPPGSRCPECGLAIAVTLDVDQLPGGILRAAEDFVYYPVAADAACTVDGAMFVADAVCAALDLARGRTPGSRTLNACDICVAARDHAREYFNDAAEARELLAAWGVGSAPQVLRVADLLVRHRCVRVRAINAARAHAELDALFNLDDVPDPES